jgi:hypothetical protein
VLSFNPASAGFFCVQIFPLLFKYPHSGYSVIHSLTLLGAAQIHFGGMIVLGAVGALRGFGYQHGAILINASNLSVAAFKLKTYALLCLFLSK